MVEEPLRLAFCHPGYIRDVHWVNSDRALALGCLRNPKEVRSLHKYPTIMSCEICCQTVGVDKVHSMHYGEDKQGGHFPDRIIFPHFSPNIFKFLDFFQVGGYRG